MKIIVGLGNPGDKYLTTFHNLGFMVAEATAQKLGVKFKRKSYCLAHIAEAFMEREKIVIAKPQTHMNLSGQSVKMLMNKYGISAQDIIVVVDDADLEVGSLRIRASGSGGTHNGLKNMIFELGTEQIPRIRVGIGNPPPGMPLEAYVLSDIPHSMREAMFEAILRASDAAIMWASGADLDVVMQRYNGPEK